MHAGAVTASKPVSARATAFAVATCAGGTGNDAAFPGNRVGPHEPWMVPERAEIHSSARWTVTQPRLPSGPDFDGPDKVPIPSLA